MGNKPTWIFIFSYVTYPMGVVQVGTPDESKEYAREEHNYGMRDNRRG